MQITSVLRPLSTLLAAGLLATACGTGDASPQSVATESASITDDPGLTPPGTTSKGTGSTPATPNHSDPAPLCATLGDMLDASERAGASETPEMLRKTLMMATTGGFDRMAGVAPPEIRDEIRAVADHLQQQRTALESADWEYLDVEVARMSPADPLAFESTAARVDDYLFSNCPSSGFTGLNFDADPVDPALVDLPDGATYRDVQARIYADVYDVSLEVAECMLDDGDLLDKISPTAEIDSDLCHIDVEAVLADREGRSSARAGG